MAAATRIVVARAAAVVCVSEYLRRELELKVPAARGKTEVVSSGVDLDRFSPTPAPDRPTRYPTVTLDEVGAARPEVILLPDEPYRFRRVHLADFATVGDVPALRAGRVRFVDGKLLSWYGARIGEALLRLPPLLAP